MAHAFYASEWHSFTFLTLEYSENFLFSRFSFTQSSILQLKTKFWQFQKSVQYLTNKMSKNFYISYAFCLLTYCSSATSMLMHYWLQSLQLFWPFDVHSSHPLWCCITHDSLFRSKMADVPACTASQFLIVHQYLHVPIFFFFFLQEHFKTPTIFWQIFFCALLPLLGTVNELPAEGEAHANSSMFTVFLSSWLIVSAFITYDPL